MHPHKIKLDNHLDNLLENSDSDPKYKTKATTAWLKKTLLPWTLMTRVFIPKENYGENLKS